MKQILITSVLLFVFVFSYSQKVIDKPAVGMNTTTNVHVEKVELRDTATVLWFHTTGTPGMWIRIPKGTYIQPVGSAKKLEALSTEGIPFNAEYYMPASGVADYKVIFPKIDPSVARIDYGEPEGGNWFLYDIVLKPEKSKEVFPEYFSGNWFGADGQWQLSLTGTSVIYKSMVWACQKYTETAAGAELTAKKGKKTLRLYLKKADDGTCMVGERPDQLVKLSKTPDAKMIPADESTFQLPLFKNDTAVIRGYVKGFSTRYPNRTGMVYVNNVLIGNQLSYSVKIENDGSFEVKFPHCNPQEVMMRMPFFSESVFAEPGKTVFLMYDNQNSVASLLFMGANARLNSEILKSKPVYSYNYSEAQNKVMDMTPDEYKAWTISMLKKDLDTLAVYQDRFHLSAKAKQFKELQLKARYYMNLFEYTSRFESAYRAKNNIPNTQRELPVKIASPDSSYYDFLTNDLVNNPLSIITSDYYFFINRLEYADIFQGKQRGVLTTDLIRDYAKSGETLTPAEKEFVGQLNEVLPAADAKLKEFSQKWGKQSEAFYKVNSEMLQSYLNENRTKVIGIADIEAYLTSKKVEFNDQEKEFIEAAKQIEKDSLVKKARDLQVKVSEFANNHQAGISEVFALRRAATRDSAMFRVAGIKKGFAADLMLAHGYLRSIAQEMTPASKEKIRHIQQIMSDPFIGSYIAMKNQEALNRIEANKKEVAGVVVNQVPKTEADKLFNAILSKYKGKVVFVDFWATWCAPCRSGIEQMKPLKDELAKEKIAFVYITGETSPKGTYDNMVPTIKGEHYRVSGDEWNLICGKFNISGIPRYMLVGKDGTIINQDLGHMGNEQLKALLMKHVKE